MIFQKVKLGYVVRFERGEELVGGLYAFCQDQSISSGWLQGLGGTTKAQVGYYNLDRKKYIFRSVKDARELVNLQGNIATVGGELALHMHAVVSDSNNRTRGGHLKKLIVAGTVEVFVHTFQAQLTRQLDSDIGLPLLNLDNGE